MMSCPVSAIGRRPLPRALPFAKVPSTPSVTSCSHGRRYGVVTHSRMHRSMRDAITPAAGGDLRRGAHRRRLRGDAAGGVPRALARAERAGSATPGDEKPAPSRRRPRPACDPRAPSAFHLRSLPYGSASGITTGPRAAHRYAADLVRGYTLTATEFRAPSTFGPISENGVVGWRVLSPADAEPRARGPPFPLRVDVAVPPDGEGCQLQAGGRAPVRLLAEPAAFALDAERRTWTIRRSSASKARTPLMTRTARSSP